MQLGLSLITHVVVHTYVHIGMAKQSKARQGNAWSSFNRTIGSTHWLPWQRLLAFREELYISYTADMFLVYHIWNFALLLTTVYGICTNVWKTNYTPA